MVPTTEARLLRNVLGILVYLGMSYLFYHAAN